MDLSMNLSSGSQLLENSTSFFGFFKSAFLGCASIALFQHCFLWYVSETNAVPVFHMQAGTCSYSLQRHNPDNICFSHWSSLRKIFPRAVCVLWCHVKLKWYIKPLKWWQKLCFLVEVEVCRTLTLSPPVIPWTNRLLTYSDSCHRFCVLEEMLMILSHAGQIWCWYMLNLFGTTVKSIRDSYV